MNDILNLKRMLADRAQTVAEMLLPGGRKEANEWRAGSIDGEKGKSLGVHLAGAKAGIWQDFATGEGGDLLDLYVACKGGTLADALDWARSFLGVERPQTYREPKRIYKRPKRPECRRPNGKVLDYLTTDRNISGHVLDAFKVGERGDDIIFPFLLPDGELALAKSRKAQDGDKPKPTSAECEPVLFGWQAAPASAREAIIAEGEIDALSWASYALDRGIASFSVPFGGGKGAKQQWIENEFERLARFEKIYVSMDMDGPGEEAAEEIISRLGRHRCYRVELPLKDANDCLMAGKSKDEMLGFLASARTSDPEGLRRPSDYEDKVTYLFWPADGFVEGYSLPYAKLTGKVIFRPGEMTLWSGASGSGKSQILSDCMPYWIRAGSRVCLASLEMKGEQTLRRMCKQTGGVDRPTARFIADILAYLDQGLLIYERVGKAGVDALIEIFDYARAKYGCDQFIIDSLMRLGIASDDYNGQEKAVFRIVDWAIANSVHVHLVAHSRKGDPRQGAPETEDIKGASEIGANAFNILTVWRNRELEAKLAEAKTDEERERYREQPGVVVNVAKQRNGDFEGKVGLYFNQENYQYHASPDKRLWRRNYLENERVAQALRATG